MNMCFLQFSKRLLTARVRASASSDIRLAIRSVSFLVSSVSNLHPLDLFLVSLYLVSICFSFLFFSPFVRRFVLPLLLSLVAHRARVARSALRSQFPAALSRP